MDKNTRSICNQTKGAKIKVSRFNGEVAREQCKNQFEDAAKFNGWLANAMAVNLVANLRGPTQQLLFNTAEADEQNHYKLTEIF